MAGREIDRHNGMLTDWQDPDDLHPDPGDMIDFDRGLYNHVGVADGQGGVYHFAGDGGKKKNNVKHRHEKIRKVANGSKVRINNTEDNERNPRSRREILRQAQKRQGTGAGTYNVVTNNCEHNATDIRYGEPVSSQSSWWQTLGFLAVGAAAVATVAIAAGSSTKGKSTDDSDSE
ncbi:phospholipase A and acyltransferase 3-like [Amphiura filiformis]|uniref:phospholipase A and acyltransferase 3-like n=1 Tax=Amphiura filiformis TaxID=82378 RepID=UPI003B20DEF4